MAQMLAMAGGSQATGQIVKEIIPVVAPAVKSSASTIKWLVLMGAGGILILLFIFASKKNKNGGLFGGSGGSGLFGGSNLLSNMFGNVGNPFKNIMGGMGSQGGLFANMKTKIGGMLGAGGISGVSGDAGKRIDIRNIGKNLNRSLEGLKSSTTSPSVITNANIIQSVFKKSSDKKSTNLGEQMKLTFERKMDSFPKVASKPKITIPKKASTPKISFPKISSSKKKSKKR